MSRALLSCTSSFRRTLATNAVNVSVATAGGAAETPAAVLNLALTTKQPINTWTRDQTVEDHIDFVHTLATMNKHPESLPINKLIAIKGTPIEQELKTKYKDRKLGLDNILRVISTARLLMPESIIRLAAGRYTMKEHEQLLCFNAGVNAIFTGEKMLTTMCTGWDEDIAMLKKWGYVPMEAFKKTAPREKLNVTIGTNNERSVSVNNGGNLELPEEKNSVNELAL
ncbi:hypothetical protein PMKS-003840 [Pichia membranifaciens]|uniref:Biotin and thiamin synthesis-associated domain-containing protein n=1 Tax=Pichia membranifaciens TaxID=4926 RepID=A0A1Q2YLC8_9ASCO|nr:hypothetical protein PMKS-003840 [Pichia membranifaciens]